MDESSPVVSLGQPLLQAGESGKAADGSGSPHNDRETSIASTTSTSSSSSPASTTTSVSAYSQPPYFTQHKSFPDSFIHSPSDSERSMHDATLSRLHSLKLSMDESAGSSSHRSFGCSPSPHHATLSSSSTTPSSLSSSSAFPSTLSLGVSAGGGELHRPLFSGFGADSWQRQPSGGMDSPYAISPASGRRQIRSAAVGDNAAYRDMASPSSREAAGAQEVQRMLGAAAQHYSVALLPALTNTQLPPSPYLSAFAEVLRAEGCAFCLLHYDLSDEQPSSASAARYVGLTSQLLSSKHIAHLPCLLSASQPASSASSNASARLDVSLVSYSSRIQALSHHSSRYHASAPTDMLGSRRFTVDLSLVHTCSNVQQAHMSWPGLISTYQAADEQQYLFLPLTTGAEDSSDSPPTGLPASAISAPSSPSPSAAAAADLVRLSALRGKLVFRCVDVATREAFEHVVPYDLTPFASLQATTRERTVLRLVHADTAAAPNVLTVVFHRCRDGRGFSVSYVRYDLRPSLAAPASYMAELAAPLPATSSPLRQPAGDYPSSFSASAAPFVPGFAAQHSEAMAAGRLAIPSEQDDQHSSLLSSPAQSPFSRSRHFASAPVSSAPSPVPSSRNINYAALNSPSHLQMSVGVDLQQQQQQQQMHQQRLLQRTQQKPSSSVSPSAMHSARGSPASFTRALNSRSSPSGYYGGGQGAEWDDRSSRSGSAGGGAESVAGEAEEFEHGDDEEDEAFDSYDHRDRIAQLASRNDFSAGNGGYSPSGRRGDQPDQPHEQSPLFLPALPTFPASAPPGLQQINLGPNPLLTLTPEAVRGSVLRLVKSHAGSRFVQQKLDARDPHFFQLFYDEMGDSVPELMVDAFAHFAVEKLLQACDDEQCLALLQRLAPHVGVVACQKHGSFSVQALVDALHTPAQVYTLVEAMKPDVLRLVTHASGHFVVLRLLQRFPYQSTKFVDDAVTASIGLVATDHHGLRVFKALLAVRRPGELTRLFKQVARTTMKLVENQYGNYSLQAVLDVAPPGVRTNIKVKMEGKYMRLSKQKFSSNVVEKCLKQSSSHWRTIIIRELTAQPAVAELLRDRYGNYVLQTALSVANAVQVGEIVRAITPYLASLRDNVRSKWKKMLKKAGTAVNTKGHNGDERDEQSEQLSPDPRHTAEDDDGEEGGAGLGADGGAGAYGGVSVTDVNVFSSSPSPHGSSPAFNYHSLSSPSSHFPPHSAPLHHQSLSHYSAQQHNPPPASLLHAFSPVSLHGLGLYHATGGSMPFGGASSLGAAGGGGGGGGYGMFGLGSSGALGGGGGGQQLQPHQHQQEMRMF